MPAISRKRREKTALASSAVGLGVAALAVAPSAEAAAFNVTTLTDNGAGSLRQAIVDANNSAGPDVVTFQAGLTGTITLTTGQLYISDDVDVQGLGPAVITVSGNNASRVFYAYSPDAVLDVRIAGLTITQGTATIGAGVVNFGETLTLDDVLITQNNSTNEGAGLFTTGNANSLTITNSTISGNISLDDGGGIYLYDSGGPTLIENSVITGNQAANDGGGIYFYGPNDTVTIRDTEISGNSANFGGGIFFYDTDNTADVLIERSTISGNDAIAGGGIFFYAPDNPITIENSTISGNDASGVGGGIFFYYQYYGMALNFVTVANNTAVTAGGGILVSLGIGTTTIDNSILGDNTAGVDNDLGVGVGAFDLRFTLLESSAGAPINDIEGNILGVDPQLGALADNGGPTETQRPALTSPVLNAADPAFGPPPATDQRGESRAYPTLPDMGAVELIGGVIQFNPTAYNVAETGGTVTLTVVRDVGPDPATVDFTTNPGTATPGVGNDYTTNSGTVNFAAGDLSETFDVTILNDDVAEPNQQFTATLSNPSPDATIGAGNVATVTITDDPAGTAQFSTATINTTEEAGTVSVTVTRTGGTEGPLTVNYTTNDGSATQPSDYALTAGMITFPAGDATPQNFNIPLVDDNIEEGTEMFTATLSGANVGSPSTVAITLAASDVQADVAAIPTLSWWGRIFLTMMSALAGLYVMVRNRFSAFLVGMLLIGLAAAPSLSAAETQKSVKADAVSSRRADQGGKFHGTLQSAVVEGNNLVLTLSGGVSLTLPTSAVTITDNRKAKPAAATVGQLVAGRQVVVKLRTDTQGNITKAKVKIKG